MDGGDTPPDSNSRTTVSLNISFTSSIYSFSAVDVGAINLSANHPLTYRISPISLDSLYIFAVGINGAFAKLYGQFIVIGV